MMRCSEQAERQGRSAAKFRSKSCLKIALGSVVGLTAASLVAGEHARPPPDPQTALIAKGRDIFLNETFDGNGRTCATCHRPEDNITISPAFIATLPPDDPLLNLLTTETNGSVLGAVGAYGNDPGFFFVPNENSINVPDLGTITLFGSGLAGLGFMVRWRGRPNGIADAAECVAKRAGQ